MLNFAHRIGSKSLLMASVFQARQVEEVMKEKYKALGPISTHEVSILICFVIVILLWFFRQPLFMTGL